jgi:DNA-binding NarL/FixJ family response regulator
MAQRWRIVIVDDHPLFRIGLRAALTKDSGIEVVGEAGNGSEAIRTVGQLAPDLMLIDLNMPVMNGLEATAEIKRRYPGVRVIVLSLHKTQEYIVASLRAGADGYVPKDASFEELCVAIRSVMAGKPYGLEPAVR